MRGPTRGVEALKKISPSGEIIRTARHAKRGFLPSPRPGLSWAFLPPFCPTVVFAVALCRQTRTDVDWYAICTGGAIAGVILGLSAGLQIGSRVPASEEGDEI